MNGVFRGMIFGCLTSLSCAVVASPLPASVLSQVQTASRTLDGARIGLSVYNANTDQSWQYNGNERFPLTSTFKALACAAALDKGELSTSIEIKADELDSYAPVTKKFVGQSLTVKQLCDAAMAWSDNTAGNLVLGYVGGPDGLTKFLRRAGDKTTQMSRWEPALNEGTPGDTRDTTTPIAINKTLRTLLFGDVLTASERIQLMTWLESDKVADGLIRSVLPKNWRIGDRTGAGGYGSRAIIAVLLPPNKKPITVSIYLTETKASMSERNEAIARIGQSIIEAIHVH
jgi:beta-lactamase class A